MVKLFGLAVLHRDHQGTAHPLKAAYDLSSFGYFQRSSVQEFMNFTSKIITERTHPANRQTIKEGEYLCHVYVRADGLSCVLVADHEYPHRVAHTLLSKVLDEFAIKVPQSNWTTGNEAVGAFSGLDATLAKYQNPREADALTKVQEELDETKIILVTRKLRFIFHVLVSPVLDRWR